MKKLLLLLNLIFLAYPINRPLSTKEVAAIQQDIDECTKEIEAIKYQIAKILGFSSEQLTELYKNSKESLELEINQGSEYIKSLTNAKPYKINDSILENFPNVEFYICSNLRKTGFIGAVASSSKIFIDKEYINNMGIILHELGHIVNCDGINGHFITTLIEKNECIDENQEEKVLKLAHKRILLMEKRADLFVKIHGHKYSDQMSSFLKSMAHISSGRHPDIKERLKYLSYNKTKKIKS